MAWGGRFLAVALMTVVLPVLNAWADEDIFTRAGLAYRINPVILRAIA